MFPGKLLIKRMADDRLSKFRYKCVIHGGRPFYAYEQKTIANNNGFLQLIRSDRVLNPFDLSIWEPLYSRVSRNVDEIRSMLLEAGHAKHVDSGVAREMAEGIASIINQETKRKIQVAV